MIEFWYALLGCVLGALGVAFYFQKESAKKATLEARLSQFQEMANALESENKILQAENQNVKEQAIRLEAEKQSFLTQIEQSKEERTKMEELLIGKFENLSHKIFEEKNEAFKKQSQESLGVLLSPLREKLHDFEKKIEESYGNHAKEQFSLKEQIKNIVDVNEKMRMQTQDLTNALKGDSKTQGNWGEIMLEKILSDSGLRKGIDYTAQAAGMNVKTEDGRTQQPDIVIHLPEQKHLIIDSKVSLTHYERYCTADQDDARALHLKQFLISVKKQIDELDTRSYQTSEKLGAPDFVLMFIPIEPAYMLALQQDPQMQNYAWNKKVVLVCPTTLFATLRTVASVWRIEMQNKNVQEIAHQGGLLYDKVAGFVSDMQNLGRQITTVEKTYGTAMNKLSQGTGNILGRTEKLKQLGAKTSKTLPPELLDTQEPQNLPDKTDQAA